MVSLKAIKRYALKNNLGGLFAQVIAAEPDEIPEADFRAKVPVWFSILKIEEYSLLAGPSGNVTSRRCFCPCRSTNKFSDDWFPDRASKMFRQILERA